MHIGAMHWSQVEARLKVDDRAIVPLGSTEQHRGAQPVGRFHPVGTRRDGSRRAARRPGLSRRALRHHALFQGLFPARSASGSRPMWPWFATSSTVCTARGSVAFFWSTAHGGNHPAGSFAIEWMADHPETAVKFHNWWNAPKTFAKVQEIDTIASHASWMENFPWTRLAGVVQPTPAQADGGFRSPAGHGPRGGAEAPPAMAISAATTNGRTTTCWRSGKSRSTRPVNSWKGRGREGPDPDLGRRGDRGLPRCRFRRGRRGGGLRGPGGRPRRRHECPRIDHHGSDRPPTRSGRGASAGPGVWASSASASWPSRPITPRQPSPISAPMWRRMVTSCRRRTA